MRYKVLIVEDSTASRDFVASILSQIDGTEVVCASSGFDALKLLPRYRFDLIITDINMPDINGLELINFVKMNPNYRETPLLIVTGEARQHDRERGMQLGASEFLIKPLQPDHLTALVRRYLKVT